MYTLRLSEYVREELEVTDHVVELRLTEYGVDRRNVSIDSITRKQVHLKDSVFVRGGNRRILFLDDLGGNITIGNKIAKDSFYVFSTAILLDKDVEEVETFFIEKGLNYIDERLLQLSKQFTNLVSLRDGRKE